MNLKTIREGIDMTTPTLRGCALCLPWCMFVLAACATSEYEDPDAASDTLQTQATAGAGAVESNAEALLAVPTPTSDKANAAIQWYIQKNGQTSYEGMCEKAVENAFGTSGVACNARSAYLWAKKQGVLHAYQSGETYIKTIPRGATLYYNTSADYHAAVFEGYYTQNGKTGGRLRSTSVNHKIGQTLYPYFQKPLGWALVDWSKVKSVPCSN